MQLGDGSGICKGEYFVSVRTRLGLMPLCIRKRQALSRVGAIWNVSEEEGGTEIRALVCRSTGNVNVCVQERRLLKCWLHAASALSWFMKREQHAKQLARQFNARGLASLHF